MIYSPENLSCHDLDLFALFCQDYFKNTERRDPTITEIKMIDTYWSDHCRHTTFSTIIQNVDIQADYIKDTYQEYLLTRDDLYKGKDKPITLMDLAVIGAKKLKKDGLLPDLDESEEINACSVKIKVDIDGKQEDWLLMFKNETHNHPTEIEPFGGAATCLGGAIRDPLSGRSYGYQAMRVTGCADPLVSLEDIDRKAFLVVLWCRKPGLPALRQPDRIETPDMPSLPRAVSKTVGNRRSSGRRSC